MISKMLAMDPVLVNSNSTTNQEDKSHNKN